MSSLSTVEIRIASANPSLVELQATGSPAVVQINMGPTGPTGPTGASGGSTSAWNYNAKTNATSGYPGNGYLLWNNATQTSATSILVSHLTDDDTDIELFLSFFVVNQKIFIQDRDDSANNQVWLISDTPTVTDAGTSTAYYTFPVTLVSSAGSAFTNNHSLLFGQISVATNAVTSATTSDGTAALFVDTLQAETSIICVGGNIVCNSTLFAFLGRNYGGGILGANAIDGSGNACFTWGVSDQNMTISAGTALTFNNTSFTYGTGAASAHVTALGLPAANTIATLAGSETLTNKTLTSPAINSATFGTAATFNATSYTFGAGAAAALNTAIGTSSVDSRIASLFAVPFQFAQDNFLGRWLTASGNNSFNWILVGSATNWSDSAFNASGFLGGVNLMVNNAAYFYYIATCAAASIANFNGVVFDQVFNINTSIASENIFIGIRNTASATAEVGRRGLYYEAGVDTNWQLLHETSAGVKTKVDTGKAVTLNQIVRVTMKFVSATQTDMIIATSTSTTPVTVSATSGFSCTGSLGLGFWLQSTTANNKYLAPMRSTVAWQTSTL
jgi:hypothetical protein